MTHKKRASLLEGSIIKQLISLTLPSIGGGIAITAFNLTDTFFVSRLGTEALAAMGFTFPIVLIIGSASLGVSLGAGSVLSRAMGKGDHHLMQRTATDGILLSMLLVAIVSITGILTMDPLFTLMGAEGEVKELLKDYMRIWYLGALAIMMPPVSDSCLRATGDMLRPFIVMMICAGMNIILDPIFIYGHFGFPAMGIRGAALATIIARCFGMVATLGFLHFHARLVDFSRPSLREIFDSWKRILHVGFPAAVTQVLPHLTRGILTRLAMGAGGAAAVAALAAGSRVEGLAAIIMMAFSMALVPMVGQNWGAGKMERLKEVRRYTLILSFLYGGVVLAVFFFSAETLASIFSDVPHVIDQTAQYLRIMAVSTFALCFALWSGQSLNAMGKPLASFRLNLAGSFLFVIPLAILGSRLHGYTGLVVGFSAGQLLTAVWAWFEGRKAFRMFHKGERVTVS